MYCNFYFCMLFSQQLENMYYDDSHMTFIYIFTHLDLSHFISVQDTDLFECGGSLNQAILIISTPVEIPTVRA